MFTDHRVYIFKRIADHRVAIDLMFSGVRLTNGCTTGSRQISRLPQPLATNQKAITLLLILEKNKRKTRTQTFALHQMILPSRGKGHLSFKRKQMCHDRATFPTDTRL